MFSFDDWKVLIDSSWAFFLEALLTSILFRILAHTLFYHHTSGIWSKGLFPHLLKKDSARFKGWIQHAFKLDFSCPFPVRKEGPFQGSRASVLLAHLCTDWDLTGDPHHGCLFRGWSPGCQWRQNHPALKYSICAHTESIKDCRHYDRLIKDSHCAKEESQAKNRI